jgi:hypothetical protein
MYLQKFDECFTEDLIKIISCLFLPVLMVYIPLKNFSHMETSPSNGCKFFSYITAVTITGNRAVNLELCLASWLLAVKVLFRSTPTTTLDLDLNTVSSEGLV